MRRVEVLLIFFLVIQDVAVSQRAVYPLQVGNIWQYIYYGNPAYPSYREEVIGDTLYSNGNHYKIVMHQNPSYTTNRYLRQGGDTVLEYFRYDSSEHVLYDFSAAPGDTIFSDGYLLTTVGRSRLDTIFGRQWRFFEFDTWICQIGFVDHLDQVADSLGLVFRESEPAIPEYLAWAIINGVQYGTITSVESDDIALPKHFQLHQNYPNPYNPATTILYDLPERSAVMVKLFNVLGQEIATLVDETQDAGAKSVEFNARNLSSGVYLYRMSAIGTNGMFAQVRKMVLQK